jgi:hypothetical protein
MWEEAFKREKDDPLRHIVKKHKGTKGTILVKLSTTWHSQRGHYFHRGRNN